MAVTIGLLGDTMLGRKVADRVAEAGPRALFAPEIADALSAADLVLANLECCVSGGGKPWPSPGKRFFFRAPEEAVESLASIGVTDVTLANNHALDYGAGALADTLRLLDGAGIRPIGAGPDHVAARRPTEVEVSGIRMALLAATDHPSEFASGSEEPGVAYADLADGVPSWLTARVAALATHNDIVLVTPHWGPNLTREPPVHVRAAARGLVESGAAVVAGHSAHVFHGVYGAVRGDRVGPDGSAWPGVRTGSGGPERTAVLFDLGDFVDDYLVHERLRNDLGAIWLLTVDERGPIRLRAIPIALDHCFTRLAEGAEYAWVAARLARACAEFGTEVVDCQDHLAVSWT